jgi:hypothetical protein
MKLEFSRWIFEKYSNINFIKIHPVGAELLKMRTDRQTDMTTLVGALRNFAKPA